jgi:DNA helicase-2/ATP-dependent DNA helicase PcrA
MLDLEKFLAHNKSMIIAPAGYGKTHTIIECVKLCEIGKKCLILTHTHAGIASIREKMKRERVEYSRYSLETISSFALQYSNAFHIDKSSIPNAEDNEYFNFAIDVTTKILKSKPIKEVIRSSYSHLIVDEYQDCTKKQHQLILVLSDILPTHILGDTLQGIFGFKNNPLINMESDEEMKGLNQNKQELDTPWRWKNTGATELGQALVNIRASIEKQESINLEQYEYSIEKVIYHENSYFQNNNCKQIIWREINNSQIQSLLLIHPVSDRIEPRLKVVQQFKQIRLIESIDDKILYKYSKLFDEKRNTELLESILSLMKSTTLKSVIDDWFRNGTTLKNKKSTSDKRIVEGLRMEIEQLLQNKTPKNIANLINKISELLGNRCYRNEFLRDILKSLISSHNTGDSVYESMKKSRDIVRRQGRKVMGKYIGTTLLTKGLEFDTVIVLEAHKFTDPKNFYVALTRACKKLIVFTNNAILTPYNNSYF